MNRAEIPIATPCNADWSTMSLADRGRFCGACRKVVRELARMTEAQARAMLASPPTEGLCVRYVHDATGEIVFQRGDVVPLRRVARSAAMVALAAALPMALTACMGAAPAPRVPGATTAPTTSAVVPDEHVMMGAPPAPDPVAPAPVEPAPIAVPPAGALAPRR
jgi:hypothetical protein